ncbi:Maf family nucleotide pyrophosphatase [Parvibaculum sp.]|uniref:Maf family nucleotide pyrophosphatase n=1 Tax=Parvibaculum sp. TaxID=2024848 RepID=UPI001B14D13D|nr:Maf family nucleotide pyrophosphatase [Parvibaculum sp.]MBO6668418.1 septum formation protein Maf [Parvibaculum sp.]MBO6691335.1 septum formation protein Maf [Parvibaculum sp.]MBO6715353.1 septum formation protein Maf [Parvibaculum sp.]
MTSPSLILASGSAVRRKLLADAGLAFTAEDSRVDEDAIKAGFADSDRNTEEETDELALKLAEAKALAVSARNESALVIGADQILSCEGRRYDKPKSMEEARANLLAFRGRPHILHSGLVLVKDGGAVWNLTARATLTMREFSEEFLDSYLAEAGDRVMKSVGCYQLEGPGVQLFEKIEGDYFSILGLPLLPLLDELRRHGVVRS